MRMSEKNIGFLREKLGSAKIGYYIGITGFEEKVN